MCRRRGRAERCLSVCLGKALHHDLILCRPWLLLQVHQCGVVGDLMKIRGEMEAQGCSDGCALFLQAEGSRSAKQDADSALVFTSGRVLDQLAVVGMSVGAEHWVQNWMQRIWSQRWAWPCPSQLGASSPASSFCCPEVWAEERM